MTSRPGPRNHRHCMAMGMARIAAYAFAAQIVLAPVAAPAQELLERNYDTSLPIEITADSLEVQQEQQIAIFRGNVDAVQGEISLKADELTVHYRAGGGNETNSVSRIVAEGNVLLTSPTETARGERGVYNVDEDTIELTGSVVLTRGTNILTGSQLELNLVTGMSRMIGTRTAAGETASGEPERVKALFTPDAKPEPAE